MLAKFKYLFLIALIGSLFLPEPALAFLGTGVFDFFEHLLGGIEEATGPMMGKMIMLLVIYVVGIVSLALSSQYLEMFINQQNDWLIQLSPMTEAGWHFTSSLANMLLVLIFLVIALAFIFKIETFQAKKTLPRLIIVALLLNFSLLFVKILVDASQIIYNTILVAGGENLFKTVMDVFIGSGAALLTNALTWISALILAWSIPIVSSFAQIAFAAIFGIIFLPNIAIWFVQAICFFILSGMFVAFIFLFGARVFIIQILAILAPLAFLCLILPQTRGFWSGWFKHLVEWLLLGIFCLFFLVLGFKAIGLLVPSAGPVPIPGWSWFHIGEYVVYYFCIFIYMGVILFISKRFLPAGAQALIDQGKALAGIILTRGLKPMGKAIRDQMARAAVGAPWAREEAERRRAAGERLTRGERLALTPLGKGLERLTVTPVRWAHRIAGTTPEEEERKRIEQIEAETEKIRDPELLLRKARAAMSVRDFGRAAGIINIGVKKGKEFKKLISKELTGEKAIRLGLEANRIGLTDQAERIGRAFVGQADRMGFKPLDTEDRAKGYRNITEKLIGEAEKDEIKDFAKNFWTSPAAMEATQRFWGGPQLGKAADEFGSKFVEDYMRVAEARPKPVKWYLENNQRALLYLTGNAAQDLGYRSIKGLSRPEARELIDWWRADRPPRRPFRRRS